MKKKAIFLITSLFIVFMLFSIAATCSFCGRTYELEYSSKETGANTAGRDENGSQQQDSTHQSGQSDNQGEPDGDDQQDEDSENNAPVIEDLEMAGMDIDTAVQAGYFDELPAALEEGTNILITVSATDADNDELDYSSYDSMGDDFEVEKIDNNHAEISWEPPTETGSYVLNIKVADRRGGEDIYSIDMNFVEGGIAEVEFIGEEAVLGPVADETGMITTDGEWHSAGNVYVGDGTNDKCLNGYISFDIIDFSEANIVSAVLDMSPGISYGDRSFLGNLRIGVLDYGTGRIEPEDGEIPADMLVQFPNTITDISYYDDSLVNALQNSIDSGSRRFQLKVYWSHPGTDSDAVSDGLLYYSSDISLRLIYTD